MATALTDIQGLTAAGFGALAGVWSFVSASKRRSSWASKPMPAASVPQLIHVRTNGITRRPTEGSS